MYNEVLDELTVVKRSGQRVEFNASKIAIAIKKAFDSINDKNEDRVFKTFEKVLSFINDNYKERKTINVEDIQDIIENTLSNQKYYDVYSSFKEYREKRALSRKVFSEKQQHKFLKAIEKFEENDFNNNLSKPYDLIYKFGRIIHSEYTKAYVLDTKSVRAEEEGNIYIHNLDYFSLGIMSHTHLLLNNKLKDIDVLLTDMINAQKEINGEIGINNLDNILVLYVLKEYKKILKSTIKKYFKLFGFYELINLKKIEELIDKEQDLELNLEKYDPFIFNENIKMIFINAFADSKKEILFISEILITKILNSLENNAERNTKYTISFGSNLITLGKNINIKLINLLSQSKFTKINIVIKISIIDNYLINEISSLLDNTKKVFVEIITEEDAEYFSNGYKIYENVNSNTSSSSGRMIVSHSSINLSRLGLKFQKKPRENFYEELDSICELIKNQMCLTFETIGNKTKDNYDTLFTGNILDDDKLETGQKIRKVIKNGCLCIGLIGLKECVMSLENDKLKQIKLINEILDYLKEKCEKFSFDTKMNFGICETIDKNARTNLLRTDKAIYGTVLNITDKKNYELIEYDFIEDYNELSKIIKKFTYGKLITFNLPSKSSNKKILDIIEVLKENRINFAKLLVGKDEY